MSSSSAPLSTPEGPGVFEHQRIPSLRYLGCDGSHRQIDFRTVPEEVEALR